MFIIKLRTAVFSSFKPAIKTVIWLMKLMLPITLGVSILDYMGVIVIISDFTEPLFKLMGLSGEAAIIFITSSFASIYAAIGVMAGFNFTIRDVTIMTTMCLICHNLIIETKIQHKAGSSWGYIIFIRIFFGLLSGYLLNLIIPQSLGGTLLMPSAITQPTSWYEVFLIWSKTILPLVAKVLLFVSSLNVLQGILKEFNLIGKILTPLKPFMSIMGLPHSTTFLWIVANTLGLAYGGMVISKELSKGEISHKDAHLLNTSIALNHSMLEDSLLFMALGVAVWWVLIPRLILAIFLTWCERLYNKIFLTDRELLMSDKKS